MPGLSRISLTEALITTTLLSIYLGSRGSVLALGAAQTLIASPPPRRRGRGDARAVSSSAPPIQELRDGG
jgi:hypothetical protein